MAAITVKPSIPKGTRDFGPAEMTRRNYIFDTIRKVFRRYGYQPIETPAMENLSTLLGKYGDEGDKLLFKILNSGDFLSSAGGPLPANPEKAALMISEKGLRYDLTVPFARYVVQHQSELTFPFKRFQIQPVWRADRPQKGRYREFYQCDVDVVGTNSLLCEVELVQIAADVFKALGINVCLKINNRKILAGMAEAIGAPDKMMDITVAIDKLDKIGLDNVNEELRADGLSDEQVEALQPILGLAGGKEEKLAGLEKILTSEVGKKGIEEVRTLFGYIDALGVDIKTELDLTLARGLNYYTGAIFEVKALDTEIGSISGGGRYDNLTGIFGLDGLSGVGISFGADRIYDVMTRLDLFPSEANAATDVLVANFGGDDEMYSLKVLARLRAEGLSGEIYPEPAKMKKQMGYADKRGIRFVVLCGENERLAQSVTIKDMAAGEQKTVSIDEAIAIIKG
ncbi:MAG: histidine--tRNA ligase [Bacteroidales bacterium]|nr:histidine--tRNA ligase [Bacteroidales bacterium]MDD7726065.1 histidine--tRNA ligase [Bacteroidales bacterium]MDY4175272.1 histidine--tRNA ligase [Bacteroidales bacterium]